LPRLAGLTQLKRQRLDEAAGRLERAATGRMGAWRLRLQAAGQRLQPRLLGQRVAAERARLADPRVTPSAALMRARLGHERARLAATMRLLASVSPDAVLARGYALVSLPGGRLVTSAADARRARGLDLRFADGTLGVAPRPAQGQLFTVPGDGAREEAPC
jgi:exodeoxyribonuclease VII large subunit